jgi:hypothetical protein
MDNERILLGSSLPLDEVEADDDRDVEGDASLQYDMLNIIDSIGTDEFKEHFLMAMNKIKIESVENQRVFCTKILEKIDSIYEYISYTKHPLDQQHDFDLVYEFISFLEFDHITFLVNIFRFFNIDFRKENISNFCKENSERIIKEVDEQIESHDFSLLLLEFLRTYIKEKMIKFIAEKTEKSKMLIYMEIKEGEMKNGRK